MNPKTGVEKSELVAIIDEQSCIGCSRCIQACPVDAILGAPRHMHTVIQQECTGCELCLAPCPVDCITLQPAPETSELATAARTRLAWSRHQARLQRLEREKQEQAARRRQKKESLNGKAPQAGVDPRKAVIQAAVARVRAKRKP